MERVRMSSEGRMKVFDAIRDNPGSHLRKLSELTGLSLSTIVHHTQHLEKMGWVRCAKENKKNSYKNWFATNTYHIYFMKDGETVGKVWGACEGQIIEIPKNADNMMVEFV